MEFGLSLRVISRLWLYRGTGRRGAVNHGMIAGAFGADWTDSWHYMALELERVLQASRVTALDYSFNSFTPTTTLLFNPNH